MTLGACWIQVQIHHFETFPSDDLPEMGGQTDALNCYRSGLEIAGRYQRAVLGVCLILVI